MRLQPTWMSFTRTLAALLPLAHCMTGCGDDAREAQANDGGIHDASNVPTLDAALQDSATLDSAAQPDTSTLADAAAPKFTMRVVRSGLQAPWELTLATDGALWVTERTGARVSSIDPATGASTTLLQLDDVYQAAGQDGLLGLAIQPASDFVYLAYTYDADASAAIDRRAKIVRYRHVAAALVEPLVLLDALSASTDHNSGRLAFGPDQRLYYTIGDQGHNQFDLACQPNHAQELPTQSEVDARDWSKYQGKILRLALDGSIPSDNPSLAGVRSHIYSYGHRNAQGLAFTADGSLYATEQGPKTDDELNQILPGRNYGWPNVAGFRDDRAYVYGAWAAASNCAALQYSDYVIPSTVPLQTESSFVAPDFTPPVRTFYTVDSNHDFMDPKCSANPFICWPTIAPSSLDIYKSNAIPSWTGSFLVTSLKDGAVHRVAAPDVDELIFSTVNRYRDLAISDDGRTFYVATDSTGGTRARDGTPTSALENLGAILEFRLQP